MKKDCIYTSSHQAIADFDFNTEVVSVFPDMIERSVPGYRAIVSMIKTLTERYAQPNTTLYDLGCSLGASTLSMAQGLKVPNCNIVAIDNAPAMIQRCEQSIADCHPKLQIIQGDILKADIQNASVVVLNFTLQFIAPDQREKLLQNIFAGMTSGGVLILSEKVHFNDPHLDELLIEIHHDFKRAQGYSDLEISQKRTALENVLIPETIPAHRQRLTQIGFSSVDVWFQCFNFMSMLAVKP
jgi:tRNA (cmo5U34)-methyltransferase